MIRNTLCLLIVGLGTATITLAQAPGERQYYSEWKWHAAKNYFYCNFNFKKDAKDDTYAYQYGIYFPSRGKRVYMYNPQTKLYWGYREGDKYAILPENKRKGSIEEIPAEDFSPLGPAPNIPGITDKVTMIPPPNSFPKLKDDRP